MPPPRAEATGTNTTPRLMSRTTNRSKLRVRASQVRFATLNSDSPMADSQLNALPPACKGSARGATIVR